MLKIKKIILPVLFFVLAVMITLCGVTMVNAAELAHNFDGTIIAGAQVRLDDDGLRFVLEMDEEDYTAYKAEGSNYTAGILFMPTELLGDGELNEGTTDVSRVNFDSDYVPKKVEKNGSFVYRFNGVLAKIPLYATNISARGFVTDGTNYTLTNTCVKSVSYISSQYYADASYSEFAGELEENIVKGYNEVAETDVESLDDMSINPVLNDANAILLSGETVEGFSSVIKGPNGLENVFDLSFTVDNSAVLTIDENNQLVPQSFGRANVKMSALGKELGSIEVSTVDTTLVDIGYGWTTLGDGTYSYYNYTTANDWGNGHAPRSTMYYPTYNTTNDTREYVDGSTMGIDSDRIIKIIPDANAPRGDYFYFKARYTKENLALLIGAGYDNIEIPVYYEVADDENGLQNSNLGGSTEKSAKAISLYTPKENHTGNMGYADNGTVTSNTNIGRLYFNNWQTVKISLKCLYDNYEMMTDLKGGDGKGFAWFGTSNANTTYGNGLAYNRSIYIGDIKAVKSSEGDTVTSINIDSPIVRDSLNSGNTQSGIVQTTLGGKTGEFVYLSNAYKSETYSYSLAKDTAKSNWDNNLYLNFGLDKEDFSNSEYNKLRLNVYTEVDRKIDGVTAAPQIIYIYNTSGSSTYPSLKLNEWATFDIPIEVITTFYDDYVGGEKYFISLSNQNNTHLTIYIDFEFVNA